MDAVDVILKDGSTLRLRSPCSDDAERLITFFAGLSDRSLYLRFHGIRTVDERLVEPVLDPDWVERGALIGTVVDGEGEEVVALANYVRLRDPAVAEAAFTVADAYQRRGIGTRLLERLAARASDHGIARFVAEVMTDNREMLGVFEDAGFELTRVLSGGEMEVEFSIAAGEAYQERVAERDHVAVVASLRPFFEPRAVAVIGASSRAGSIGGELFRNILRAGFTGAAYPINRDGKPVSGVHAYRSIEEIADELDLAVLCVPARDVLEAAGSALRHGVRALVVISAGFAEVGSEGVQRQEELLALVRAHGGRLIGPNCLGIAVAGSGLDATFAARSAAPGNIGFSSQSGALGLALLEAAVTRGLGLSAFVSIGNKADVSSNDLLEWWEDDDGTAAILLYLESFGNPRRFGRLARRVARKKPILALKSGTSASGQRAASSHTAALAGSETAVDALFHQAGVIRAGSLEELIDVATLVSSQPRLAGRNVALVTNAGGLGILAADACDAAGLELAVFSDETVEALREVLPAEASVANPVDMLGGATAGSYAAVVPALLSDPAVDALIALFVPAVSSTADDVAAAIEQAAAEAEVEKPVLAVVISAEGVPARVPVQVPARRHRSRTQSPRPERSDVRRSAPSGCAARRERSPIRRESIGWAATRSVAGALARGDDVWLSAGEVRALLVAYGIPVVPEEVAEDADEAVAAAQRLGLPVVVKSAAPGAHKTELGGIALDLDTEESVRQASERIGCPVLVQPMVVGGAELLAGMVQDPVFGPLVAFGPGGVLAELIGEASFRLAPLTDVDAEELVTSGKAGRLVAGFRGAPAADAVALADLVHRLGRLGDDHPAIAEIDLNPVLALPDRCVAVDARVRVRHPDAVERQKSW